MTTQHTKRPTTPSASVPAAVPLAATVKVRRTAGGRFNITADTRLWRAAGLLNGNLPARTVTAQFSGAADFAVAIAAILAAMAPAGAPQSKE